MVGEETHVARYVYIPTHDNDLFDTEESLWIFCCRQCQVGERANCSDRDSVWLILAQKA